MAGIDKVVDQDKDNLWWAIARPWLELVETVLSDDRQWITTEWPDTHAVDLIDVRNGDGNDQTVSDDRHRAHWLMIAIIIHSGRSRCKQTIRILSTKWMTGTLLRSLAHCPMEWFPIQANTRFTLHWFAWPWSYFNWIVVNYCRLSRRLSKCLTEHGHCTGTWMVHTESRIEYVGTLTKLANTCVPDKDGWRRRRLGETAHHWSAWSYPITSLYSIIYALTHWLVNKLTHDPRYSIQISSLRTFKTELSPIGCES